MTVGGVGSTTVTPAVAPEPRHAQTAGSEDFARTLAQALAPDESGRPTLSGGRPPSITLAAALGLTPAIPVPVEPVGGGGATGVSPVRSVDSVDGVHGPSVGGDWKSRLPAAGRQWADEIEAAATRNGLDPRLLAALVKAESGFRPSARSHAGAIGLAQLMPGTARELGVDPYNPRENLEGGAKFLKAMLDKFGSNDLALAAYNAGPARVARAGGIPNIRETQAYVPRVLRFYEQLR